MLPKLYYKAHFKNTFLFNLGEKKKSYSRKILQPRAGIWNFKEFKNKGGK